MARAVVSEGESLPLGGSIAPGVSGGGGRGGDAPARSATPPHPQRLKMSPHCTR